TGRFRGECKTHPKPTPDTGSSTDFQPGGTETYFIGGGTSRAGRQGQQTISPLAPDFFLGDRVVLSSRKPAQNRVASSLDCPT
ncbi:unnamed protein product, partial [Gulo gulo]